jgi:hypothetical protein
MADNHTRISQAADIIKAAASALASTAVSPSNTVPDQTDQPPFSYEPEEPASPSPSTTQPPALPEGPIIDVTTVTMTTLVTVFV